MEALDEAVIGLVRLTPSAMNYVRETGSIRPIETGARFDISSLSEQELERSIKEIFFSDLISLPPSQGTPMSATEALQRWEIMHLKLGPAIGRLKTELLQWIVIRSFGILARAGEIEPAPASVKSFFGGDLMDVDVEYDGPLERAQRSSDLVAIERTYASILPIAEVRPEVLDVIDHDAVARRGAEVSGLSSHFLKTPEEVEAVREARAEQIQVQNEAELAERTARAEKSAAQAAQVEAQTPVTPGG